MPDTARFAAISCVHVGPASKERLRSLDFILSTLTDDQKHNGPLQSFVMLGDLLDAQAASVHPRDDNIEHTLEDEFRDGADYLEAIRRELPKNCDLIWCLGNHDSNILVADARRIQSDLRSLCDWNAHAEHGKVYRKWRQVPYQKPSIHDRKGCYELGQAVFFHGFDAGSNSDELEGLQVAYALGGNAHRLMVRGHTHRPKHVTQCKRSANVLLPYWYANAGTAGPMGMEVPYMQRKDQNQWNCGVVIGEAKLGRVGRMNGKCWSARTVIRDQ